MKSSGSGSHITFESTQMGKSLFKDRIRKVDVPVGDIKNLKMEADISQIRENKGVAV